MSEPSDRRVPRGLGPEHEVIITTPASRTPGRGREFSMTPAEYAELMAKYGPDAPTLAEHAELVQADPLAGVPLRGLLRICWAVTQAGFRDAWARLRGLHG